MEKAHLGQGHRQFVAAHSGSGVFHAPQLVRAGVCCRLNVVALQLLLETGSDDDLKALDHAVGPGGRG